MKTQNRSNKLKPIQLSAKTHDFPYCFKFLEIGSLSRELVKDSVTILAEKFFLADQLDIIRGDQNH